MKEFGAILLILGVICHHSDGAMADWFRFSGSSPTFKNDRGGNVKHNLVFYLKLS